MATSMYRTTSTMCTTTTIQKFPKSASTQLYVFCLPRFPVEHTSTSPRLDTPDCFERTIDDLRTNFDESPEDSQDGSMELEIRELCLYPPRYLTQGS